MLHEKLRKISLSARKNRKPFQFLISEIEKDSDFRLSAREIKPLLSPDSLIGRAAEQTLEFLKDPFLQRLRKTKISVPSVEF